MYRELGLDSEPEEDQRSNYSRGRGEVNEQESYGEEEDDDTVDVMLPDTVPWDSRGKTGLYGGGGRGADDKETGWVNGYSQARVFHSGGAEDHLVHQEASPTGFPYIVDSPPSSSTSPNFIPASPVPTVPFAKSSLDQAISVNYNSETNSLPLSPLRPPPPVPSISSPVLKPHPTTPATHTLVSARQKPTFPFSWKKSRKPPVISNPILPPDFISSLGMATFDLTPGVKPPTPIFPIFLGPTQASSFDSSTNSQRSRDDPLFSPLSRLSTTIQLSSNSTVPRSPDVEELMNDFSNQIRAIEDERPISSISAITSSTSTFAGFRNADRMSEASRDSLVGPMDSRVPISSLQIETSSPIAIQVEQSATTLIQNCAPFGAADTATFRDPWGISRPSVSSQMTDSTNYASTRPSVSSEWLYNNSDSHRYSTDNVSIHSNFSLEDEANYEPPTSSNNETEDDMVYGGERDVDYNAVAEDQEDEEEELGAQDDEVHHQERSESLADPTFGDYQMTAALLNKLPPPATIPPPQLSSRPSLQGRTFSNLQVVPEECSVEPSVSYSSRLGGSFSSGKGRLIEASVFRNPFQTGVVSNTGWQSGWQCGAV